MRRAALLCLAALWAFAIDYGDRSTQELLAALRSVRKSAPSSPNLPVILHELKKRTVTMTPKERKIYRKLLEELSHAGEK